MTFTLTPTVAETVVVGAHGKHVEQRGAVVPTTLRWVASRAMDWLLATVPSSNMYCSVRLTALPQQ